MTAIAVYCASITRIDPAFLGLATAVGTAIGERGHTLVPAGKVAAADVELLTLTDDVDEAVKLIADTGAMLGVPPRDEYDGE